MHNANCSAIKMALFSVSTLSPMIVARTKFKKCALTYAYLICHVYLYSIISLRNHFIYMYRISFQISEVGLAVPHCQLCNMYVWYSLRNVECYISDLFFDSSASINDGAFS